MSLIAACGDCGKEYSFRRERAGQVLPCKECGGRIRVPGRLKRSRGRSSAHSSNGRRRHAARQADSFPVKLVAGIAGAVLVLIVIGVVLTRQGDGPVAGKSGGTPDREQVAADDLKSSELAGNTVADTWSPSESSPLTNQSTPFSTSRNRTETQTQDTATPPATTSTTGTEEPALPNGLPANVADMMREAGLDPNAIGKPGASPGGLSGFTNAPPSLKLDDDPSSVDWVSVVDPIPPALLNDWEPARANRVLLTDSGRFEPVFGGPGSPFVAVAGERNEWNVYDLRRRRRIGRGSGDNFRAETCGLRADGKYFAVNSREGLIVTDVPEEVVLGTLPTPEGAINGNVFFLGEDKIAAVQGEAVNVWKLPSGDPTCSIPTGGSFSGRYVRFTPGGRYAIVIGGARGLRSKRLIFYETDGGKHITSIPLSGVTTEDDLILAVSDDGRQLAAMEDSGEIIHIWDLQSGELVEQVEIQQSLGRNLRFENLEWFPDGEHLLISRHAVLNRSSGQVIFAFPEDGRWSGPATVAGDGALIAFDSETRSRGPGILAMDSKEFQEIVTAMSTGGSVVDAGLPALTSTDRESVVTVDPSLATPGWQVEADPAQAPEGEFLDSFGIPNRNEKLLDIRFSGYSAASAALYYDPRPGSSSSSRRKSAESRVELFSLVSGRRTAELALPFDCSLLALSGSGNFVAMRLTKDKQRVDIWNCADKTHVCGFRPYSTDEELEASVFVDDQHLLTLSKDKDLTLWKIPECKAIYEIEEAEGPRLSPTGKYLAIRSKNVYALLEAQSGEVVGRLVADDNIRAASFHPDGKKFAAVSQVGGYFETKYADLMCWDMETGDVIAHVPLHAAGSSMHWCGEDHVLIDNTLLVDVKRGVPEWTYGLSGQRYQPNAVHCFLPPDDRHWYVAKPDRGRSGDLKMFAVSMPGQNEVVPENATPATMLAMKPGGSVRIKLSLPQHVLQSAAGQKIKTHVVAELGRNGIQIDNSSPTVLELNVEERVTGETDTYRFGGGFFGGPIFGGGRNSSRPERTESAQSYEVVCVTRFMQGTDTLWESTRTIGNPYFLSLRDGESLQQKLAEGRWESAASYFGGVRLPKYVYKAGHGYGYGTTTLTYDGPVFTGTTAIRPDKHFGYRGGSP